MIAWIAPVATSSASAAASPADEPAQASCSSAEVAFTASRRFAIVGEPHGKRRHLYVNGDVIPNLKAEGQGFVVEQVLMDGVQLRDTRSRQAVRMGVGVVIPETGGRRLEGTVLLDGLEYCYLRGVAAPDPEPRLLQVQGRRARLVVEMAAPPDAASAGPAASAAFRTGPSEVSLQLTQRLDEAILEKVQVRPAGRDTYDLSAAEVQMALEHGGKILMEAMATVRPMLSLDEGIAFRVRSPVADGVLGPRGFKVDNPNLAQRAGIEAGDVVTAVNGQPVNGFADLYHLYRQARSDRRVSTISLDLQRDGQRVIKTYRIR
jgi:S1-C subfamily serine protease